MVLNAEEGLECEVHVYGIRLEYLNRKSKFRNLNIWSVFWTNQVQMGQNAVGRCRVEGGLHGPWLMLEICSLSVVESCMRRCL